MRASLQREFAHPGGLVYCSEPQATTARQKESRSDSQAVQRRWTAHHHPSDFPGWHRRRGRHFRIERCLRRARGHPKLLAHKQPATTPVDVEGVAAATPQLLGTSSRLRRAERAWSCGRNSLAVRYSRTATVPCTESDGRPLSRFIRSLQWIASGEGATSSSSSADHRRVRAAVNRGASNYVRLCYAVHGVSYRHGGAV